jgi:hypothetical protein
MTGPELILCIMLMQKGAYMQNAHGAAKTPTYVFEEMCIAEDPAEFVGFAWGSQAMKNHALELRIERLEDCCE